MFTQEKLPLQIWILTLSAFAIGTAEFVIAGILPRVAGSLQITEGRAGSLITAYALAIVFGGPLLTLWLARFEKRTVLLALMALFVLGNVLAALGTGYPILLLSRIIAGLTQGPFYGIGAVVATRLAPPGLAGRAVGQMFIGLTLANVLGVPAGAWIGNTFGWSASFGVVALLGVIASIAIAIVIRAQGAEPPTSVERQLAVFRSKGLLASLLITVLVWAGFMCFYGYIAPIAERVAGFAPSDLWWVLVIVGAGLVLGNTLGGRSADADLRLSLRWWPAAMIASLLIVGVVASWKLPFLVAAFSFGVASFANVSPMQMRVMSFGSQAPELAATANIAAFNTANAIGGFLGGYVVDSHFGAAAVPFVAAVIPFLGLAFILVEQRRVRDGAAAAGAAVAVHPR
jgi:MFS transporter, DHA1 family, inner membrane transport protein